MENRYEKYLPKILNPYDAFRKLAEIEGGILEEEAKEKETVEQSQWILTSGREGLLRRARFMGLRTDEGEDTEELRQRVLSYWNSQMPYTFFLLCHWLDGYCGAYHYRAEMDYGKYHLLIVLKLSVKEKREHVFQWIRYRIPANIILEVVLDTNTHRKVGWLTHGQLKNLKLTYGEIPLYDLSAYEK